MDDIVERLRFHPADEDEVYRLFNEAADEIERLRKVLAAAEGQSASEVAEGRGSFKPSV